MTFDVPPLANSHVALLPLLPDHRAELQVAANDPRIWTLQLVCGDGDAFSAYFDNLLLMHATRQRFIFVVRDQRTQQLVGSTGYLDIHPEHRRIEIGGTWYQPDAWGTVVNPACKLLLLTHAFDVLNLNRVSFVVDARNARSQAAVCKLGGVPEGILRADRITWTGHVRDTAVFSILAAEWPAVRARLQARVGSSS